MTLVRVAYVRHHAPFYVNHRWEWHTWTVDRSTCAEPGNKHLACADKARELGATMWDCSQL